MDRLAPGHPLGNDRKLEASLARLLGSRPEPVWKDKMGKHGWDGELVGFRLPKMSEETRSAAIALIAAAVAPMPLDAIIGLLGELKLLTTSRRAAESDTEAQLMLYARKIAEYPADVAAYVLKTQADMSTFWPSWAELRVRLEMWAGRRRILARVLARVHNQEPTDWRVAPPLAHQRGWSGEE